MWKSLRCCLEYFWNFEGAMLNVPPCFTVLILSWANLPIVWSLKTSPSKSKFASLELLWLCCNCSISTTKNNYFHKLISSLLPLPHNTSENHARSQKTWHTLQDAKRMQEHVWVTDDEQINFMTMLKLCKTALPDRFHTNKSFLTTKQAQWY